MTDINVVICGVLGRMGSALTKLCLDDPEVSIVGAVERLCHPNIGMDIGNGFTVTDEFEKYLTDDGVDVFLDFTDPVSAIIHLGGAVMCRKPVVIGTTGFTPMMMATIHEYSHKIPVVLAPNFSVGVNIMFKVLADVARITGDAYDVEIVEAHHNQKKDAPSGTAMKMGRLIAEVLNHNRDKAGLVGLSVRKGGENCPRAKDEIGISIIRGGDIFGTHNVKFCGQGETMEFIHRASSRDNFARGAIRAAKWVMGKPEGLYDMQDVLGLR